DDKPRLAEIMAGMSPSSRWLRFFTAREKLSERELTYLAQVDEVDHVALLATRGDESVAVARFVRNAKRRDVAEPAMSVIDRLQPRGLGRILFGRLVDAAGERGVERFEAEVLAMNRTMLRLLGDTGPTAGRPGDSVTRIVELARLARPSRWGWLRALV